MMIIVIVPLLLLLLIGASTTSIFLVFFSHHHVCPGMPTRHGNNPRKNRNDATPIPHQRYWGVPEGGKQEGKDESATYACLAGTLLCARGCKQVWPRQ